VDARRRPLTAPRTVDLYALRVGMLTDESRSGVVERSKGGQIYKTT
jgi:hypothetical protein